MKKWLLLALAALLVAAAAAWWWKSNRVEAGGELVLHGNVDIRQVELAFNASGRLDQVLVQEGDRVTKGQLPARLEMRAWFNPNLESRWFFIPGIIGMLTLVVTMLVTALTVAREREQGTFDQLLVTPLRPGEILIGKTVPGFVIGIVQATLILLVAVFWFEVPFLGSLPAFYAGLALFLLSGVGAGLLISALSATQ